MATWLFIHKDSALAFGSDSFGLEIIIVQLPPFIWIYIRVLSNCGFDVGHFSITISAVSFDFSDKIRTFCDVYTH